jgi:hypothetical protein
MDLAPGTVGDGDFDPYQAAALLDQATQQARRTFTPGTPALWVFRAVLVLVAFGGFWLSVRGQHPYSGPTGTALPVTFALVAVNIGWSARAIRRAGAGVSGPAERKRRIWIGVMVLVMVAAYAFTAPLYPAGASHPVWGLYEANAPMLVVGLTGAVTAAARRDRPHAGILSAIAAAAVAAGLGGPVGAWLIMGIGLCAVCLGTAAYTARAQRRSVVGP